MATARFTVEQVQAAVQKHGSVLKAAKALGCADVTVYNYLRRAKTTNGHATTTMIDDSALWQALVASALHYERRAKSYRDALELLARP